MFSFWNSTWSDVIKWWSVKVPRRSQKEDAGTSEGRRTMEGFVSIVEFNTTLSDCYVFWGSFGRGLCVKKPARKCNLLAIWKTFFLCECLCCKKSLLSAKCNFPFFVFALVHVLKGNVKTHAQNKTCVWKWCKFLIMPLEGHSWTNQLKTKNMCNRTMNTPPMAKYIHITKWIKKRFTNLYSINLKTLHIKTYTICNRMLTLPLVFPIGRQRSCNMEVLRDH